MEQDVSRLREGLGPLPPPVARPVLVMVCGLPGVGKTHFSRLLAERVPVAVLETDALRRQLFGQPTYSQKESYRLFRACHRLARRLLKKGISVLFDATSLREQYREDVYRIAGETGAKLVVVWVQAPEEVVRSRLEGRALGGSPDNYSEATWQVYQKIKSEAEPVSRPHLVVDTSQDITPALEQVAGEALSECAVGD